MSILILGATGLIGNRLVRTLGENFEVFGSTRKKEFLDPKLSFLLKERNWLFDVSPEKFFTLEEKIQKIKPNVIVNCLGVTKLKPGSSNLQKSILVNSIFPHNLSATCREFNIRLIHLSTDCVFSGSKGNYVENDVPDPIDVYGITKSLGELINENDLTIRTSFVGRELSSFTNLFEWAMRNKNKSIRAYSKAIYSGLTTLALSKIIKSIILDQATLSGLWHVSSEPISKYELLSNLNHALSLNMDIELDDKFICDRSLNSKQFRERTKIQVPKWPEMLKEFAKDQRWYEKVNDFELRAT